LFGVTISLLGASLFYSVWLATFLLTAKLENLVADVAFWLLAPVVTGAGFATGITIFEHLTKTSRAGFLRIFAWPLVGCGVGAFVVYWFGPMLIVFGMFVAGTASIVLREVIQFPEDNRA
jgi:hypothetical protein